MSYFCFHGINEVLGFTYDCSPTLHQYPLRYLHPKAFHLQVCRTYFVGEAVARSSLMSVAWSVIEGRGPPWAPPRLCSIPTYSTLTEPNRLPAKLYFEDLHGVHLYRQCHTNRYNLLLSFPGFKGFYFYIFQALSLLTRVSKARFPCFHMAITYKSAAVYNLVL